MGLPVLNARWPRKRKGDSEFEDCWAVRIPVHFSGRITEEENPQHQQQQKMESDRQDNHQRGAGPTGITAWVSFLMHENNCSCLEYTVGFHLCVIGDNNHRDKTETDADTWRRRHCYWWLPKRCCPGSVFWGPGKNIFWYFIRLSLLSCVFSLFCHLSLHLRVCSCSCAHMFLGIEPRSLHMVANILPLSDSLALFVLIYLKINLMSYFLLKVLRLSNKDKQWLLGIVFEFWSETSKPINVCWQRCFLWQMFKNWRRYLPRRKMRPDNRIY